jgi:hypothetical protein
MRFGDSVPPRNPPTVRRKNRTGETVMTNEQVKCAHVPCRCVVQASDKYCSQPCKEAGSKEVEIACQCDHGACPLTP